MREIIFRATHDQGEYPTYYALMIIESGSNVESLYGSFKELPFIKAPSTFEMARNEKLPCKPVIDPLAVMADTE